MTQVVLSKYYKLVDPFLKLSGVESFTNFTSPVSRNIYLTFTNTMSYSEGGYIFREHAKPSTFPKIGTGRNNILKTKMYCKDHLIYMSCNKHDVKHIWRLKRRSLATLGFEHSPLPQAKIRILKCYRICWVSFTVLMLRYSALPVLWHGTSAI